MVRIVCTARENGTFLIVRDIIGNDHSVLCDTGGDRVITWISVVMGVTRQDTVRGSSQELCDKRYMAIVAS